MRRPAYTIVDAVQDIETAEQNLDRSRELLRNCEVTRAINRAAGLDSPDLEKTILEMRGAIDRSDERLATMRAALGLDATQSRHPVPAHIGDHLDSIGLSA